METSRQRDLLLLGHRGGKTEIASAGRAAVTTGEEIAAEAATGDTDTVLREVTGSTAGLAQGPGAQIGRGDTGTGITRGQDHEIERRDLEAEIGRTGTGDVGKTKIAPGAVSVTGEATAVERDHHIRIRSDEKVAESSLQKEQHALFNIHNIADATRLSLDVCHLIQDNERKTNHLERAAPTLSPTLTRVSQPLSVEFLTRS